MAENIEKRVCDKRCEFYMQDGNVKFCDYQGKVLSVNSGNKCLYDLSQNKEKPILQNIPWQGEYSHQRIKSNKSVHPFAEWGKEPLAFP